MTTQRINMDIDKQLWKQVGIRAIQEGINKKDLVEKALTNYLRGGEKMKKELIKEELDGLYRELNELKEELHDYYSENSGFSNGADFSLGFASRSKHIVERINELEVDLNEYNKYWVVDISETVTETRYEGNNKAEAIKCGKDWVWRYPPTTNKIEVREIFPVDFDEDGEVVNYDYKILWESK